MRIHNNTKAEKNCILGIDMLKRRNGKIGIQGDIITLRVNEKQIIEFLNEKQEYILGLSMK